MKFTILNEMAKGTTYDPFASKRNQDRAKRDAINFAKRHDASVERRKQRDAEVPIGEHKFYFLRPGDIEKTLMPVDEILEEEGGYDFIFGKSDVGHKAGKSAVDYMTDLERYARKKLQESFARS